MKHTKKALLTSALCLLLCMSMLIGTTFAWFTDEVKSGTNIIAAGNLDIELYHTDAAVENEPVNGGTKLFDDVYPSLWEPGAVAYEILTVKNEGTLALKYNLAFHALNATVVNGKSLADALKVAVVDEADLTDRASAIAAGAGKWQKLTSFDLPEALAAGESDTYGIVIYWEPTANDNDFNMNNENKGKTLSIELGVHLTATQLTAENDSFDKYYDGAAAWNGMIDYSWYNAEATELTIGSAEELAGLAAIANGVEGAPVDTFAGKTIKLVSDIDLNNLPWAPIGDPMSDGYIGFEGTFDGDGHTVYNLYIHDTTAWGQGLFGYSVADVTIQNLNIHNAAVIAEDIAAVVAGWFYNGTMSNVRVTGDVTVRGASYVGGIAGQGYYANFVDCSVVANAGSSITATTSSFAGGIVGYQNDASKALANCGVANLSITGYGAIGGIAGIVSSGADITGCTVENVDLYKTRVDGNPSIGALVGCYSGTSELALSNNTVRNVTLNGTHVEYSAFHELYGSSYTGSTNGTFALENNTVENLVNNLNVINAATPETIQDMINAAAAGDVITLVPGAYHDTIVMKSGITLQGTEGAVVDCINLNGAANVTLKGITFDAAGAKGSYDGAGNGKQYANIISREKGSTVDGAANIVIENCIFTGEFANGGVAMCFADQRKAGYSNITVKGCVFETTNGYYDIYAHYSGNNGYFIIEGNTFNSKIMKAEGIPESLPNIFLGQYQSSVPVVVKGNTFADKASFDVAAYIQPHSSGVYTVSFDASENIFNG